MWILYLIGGFYTFCAIIWVIDRVKKIPLDIKEKERIAEAEKLGFRRAYRWHGTNPQP